MAARREALDLLIAFLIENGYDDEGTEIIVVGVGSRRASSTSTLPPWKGLTEDIHNKCFLRRQNRMGLIVIQNPIFKIEEIDVCRICWKTRDVNHIIHLECTRGHSHKNSLIDLHDPKSLDELKNELELHNDWTGARLKVK